MNIFESMAHALLAEHGRRLFRRDFTHSSSYGFETTFWKIALLCYGKDFYKLPQKMNLPLPAREPTTFAFPAFTVEGSMHLGIPLPELLLYPTVSGYNHRYTPIHLGTGLLLFGGSYEEADELLQVDFMKKLWPLGRKPEEFSSQTVINPFKPEDVGRKPYDIRLFWKGENGDHFHLFDELGSALWFPTEYVERGVTNVSTELWFHSIYILANLDARFSNLRASAARRQLHATAIGKRHTYSYLAKYIRFTSKNSADSYIRGSDKGVAAVAACFRADADPETMAIGLRILATSKSETLDNAYRYIGRALTYEDLALLAPQHALTILRSVHFDIVKDAIATRSQDLSSMFFKLPANRMKEVMDCMSPVGRDDKWFPDTPMGNENLFNSTTLSEPRDHKAEWDKHMRPLISKYVEAKMWRKRLLDIADPDVAFLALMREVAKDDDPVPRDAIMNVLVSHPNAGGILEHVREQPVLPQAYSRL